MSDERKQPPEKVTTTAGAKVSREFHDDGLRRLLERIPALRWGEAYTTEQLFCPRYWRSLDATDRWRLGCCVADWVRDGLVRLRFVGCRYCKVRHYERA